MSNLDKLLNNYAVLQVFKNYCTFGNKDEVIFPNLEELIFFIDEIRADEREACAKVCDGWTHADGDVCAEAIRARSEK